MPYHRPLFVPLRELHLEETEGPMTKPLSLGFVGTGDITRAIVTGLMTHAERRYEIWLSPRNERNAKELAERYPGSVRVARDNQDVVTQAEIVFLAVRPQVAPEVLGALRFSADQCAVSLIAGYGTQKIRSSLQTAPARIERALPLPMTARAASRTVIYPADARVRDIFDAIGGALSVESETQFDTMLALSASMGLFFAIAHAQSAWASQHGVEYDAARSYLMSLYRGLADTALLDGTPLDTLSREFSTIGGINEQVVALMTQARTFENISQTYDQIEARIVARSVTTRQSNA